MEYPLFFKDADQHNLYGDLHLPDTRIRETGVVFCSPICGEKTKSYRVPVSFARALTNEGFPVLRFDYRGEGDSEGDFEDATIETRVDDIVTACGFMMKQAKVDRIVLAGLRMGATLAAMAGRRHAAVDGLVLWYTVENVKDYLYDMLRVNLTQQLMEHRKVLYNRERLIEDILQGSTVNVDGWLIAGGLWKEGIKISFSDELQSICRPMYIVRQPSPDIPVESAIERSTKTIVEYLPPEFSWSAWKHYTHHPEVLFRRTMSWIMARYGSQDVKVSSEKRVFGSVLAGSVSPGE